MECVDAADGKPAYERIFGDKSGSSEKNNGLTCKIGILWNFGNIQASNH
jgi:hypothetical protein